MTALRIGAAVCLLAFGSNTSAVIAHGTDRGRGPGTQQCHDIDADFTSELAPGDPRCTSPTGLCAAGSIRHDAVLKGAMFVSIDDSAPDLRATAHRQAAQARILPLPCLHKARHQSQPHASAQAPAALGF